MMVYNGLIDIQKYIQGSDYRRRLSFWELSSTEKQIQIVERKKSLNKI